MGEASMWARAGLAIVRPFFDLALWGAVVYVLVQLSKKVPQSSLRQPSAETQAPHATCGAFVLQVAATE